MVLAGTTQTREDRAPYAPPALTYAGTFMRRTKGFFGFFREGFIGRFY